MIKRLVVLIICIVFNLEIKAQVVQKTYDGFQSKSSITIGSKVKHKKLVKLPPTLVKNLKENNSKAKSRKEKPSKPKKPFKYRLKTRNNE